MKNLVTVFSFLFSIIVHAQEKVVPTKHFSIEGKVKNKLVFGFKDAAGYKVVSLDSLVIYNHLHARKRVVNNIKGILLKDILTKAEIEE